MTLAFLCVFQDTLALNANNAKADKNRQIRPYPKRKQDADCISDKSHKDESPIFAYLPYGDAKFVTMHTLPKSTSCINAVPQVDENGKDNKNP